MRELIAQLLFEFCFGKREALTTAFYGMADDGKISIRMEDGFSSSFYGAITGLGMQSVRNSYMQHYRDNVRLEYGRDATPEETAFAQEHLQDNLDEIMGDEHQSRNSVIGNWFWGPVWISIVAGVLLKTRGHRLKWRPNLDRFIEKVEPENNQKAGE